MRERFKKPLEYDFFIVPKLPFNMEDSEYWRLDFLLGEDQIIYNYGFVRPVIKLLKYFRDCNEPLRELMDSYKLKTLVMLMIKEDPSSMWNNKDIAKNFLRALHFMNKKLHQGRIEHVFVEKSNLFVNLKFGQLNHMSSFLSLTIDELERSLYTRECRSVWLKYFQKPGPN